MLAAFESDEISLTVAGSVSSAKELARAFERFSSQECDLLLIITLSGLSAPLIEAAATMAGVPCLVWPVPGKFALPSSSLAVGALREAGHPADLLFAPPIHPVAIARSTAFTRAARAYSRMRQTRIGVIGGLFPNLVACRYDQQAVFSSLGITLLSIPFTEVRDAMQTASLDKGEIERHRSLLTESNNGSNIEARSIDPGIALHLALKQLARQHDLHAFATECWSALPRQLGLNPCLGFVDDSYVLGCEGDVMMCASLLMARYLTGRSAYAGDLYDVDMDGVITLTHCGAPASLASHPCNVSLEKSQLAEDQGFETITCRPRLDPGPVTLFRLYGRNCEKMHLASGEIIASEISPRSAVQLKLCGNRWHFLDRCLGNHYVMVAGDLRDGLRFLCNWFAITMFET